MPIYEYQCTSCHHHFDLMQKISDKPATQCPKCYEQSLVKLVSAAGFQLKGTGWYATDFKNKGSKDKGNTGTNAGKDGAAAETAPKETESKKTDATKQTKGDD